MTARDFAELGQPSLSHPHLPELFEEQVNPTPDSLAAVCAEQHLTYRALNERANRLAHVLVERGVGPQAVVAVALERSVDMVAGVLAILKTGAAYLPLDPEYPAERLAFMLADAKPSIVLASVATIPRLPQNGNVWAVDAPDMVARLGRAPLDDLRQRERCGAFHPNHPAYLIYTSGSTGVPKGVVIEHRTLSAFARAIAPIVGFEPGDRHIAVTTLAFDIAIVELLLPLCQGATVVIASRDEVRDPSGLWTLIRASRATSLQAAFAPVSASSQRAASRSSRSS